MRSLVILLTVLLSLGRQEAPFPPRAEMVRLYTNCDEPRWPGGLSDSLVPKTNEELAAWVARRPALELQWRLYFARRAGDSLAPTGPDQWVYPLAVRGRLLDNFLNPREGGPHEALDIFVAREGVTVLSPVAGVVIASGDDWVGGWSRRDRDVWYEGGGLSRRAGNGLLIFDPGSGGYHYFAHLENGLMVSTGDVVAPGRPLGRVGHTGNASQPGHGRHLHYTYKRPGTACGHAGVLVAENPYPRIRSARLRMGVR
jgi:murein DD-endopeptidase MepM/ murein hydrolase activator NlpD